MQGSVHLQPPARPLTAPSSLLPSPRSLCCAQRPLLSAGPGAALCGHRQPKHRSASVGAGVSRGAGRGSAMCAPLGAESCWARRVQGVHLGLQGMHMCPCSPGWERAPRGSGAAVQALQPARTQSPPACARQCQHVMGRDRGDMAGGQGGWGARSWPQDACAWQLPGLPAGTHHLSPPVQCPALP